MKSKTKFFQKNLQVLIFVVLVFSIFATLIAFNTDKLQAKLSFKTTQPSTVQANNQITLPVDFNNKNVTSAYLAYNFFGPIKEIVDVTQGKEIILDVADNTLPKFIVQDQVTTVQEYDQKLNKVTPSKAENLQAGERISISTTYDLKNNLWITRSIHILK